ncbi:MAG: dimethylarginine dimethylaminohydrolase family protein [bacterium]
MLKAIVQNVSPKINQCELTFLKREPIDYEKGVRQHQAYCALLEKCGVEVVYLTSNSDYPDATFVEDTAIVFDEIAIIASMGAASRRKEVAAIERELSQYRKIVHIEPPATLEGGDVVCLGSTVFVGLTKRTNEAGIKALKKLIQRYDYEVVPVHLEHCLHLKSACTALSDRSLLVNPEWVDITPFAEFNVITIAENEPWAANAIRINDTVCLHSLFPETAQHILDLDFKVETVDISEFLKAEGGMSCLSLRFETT